MSNIETVKHWRVDEVIECLDGVTPELERELLKACPDAYEKHDDDPDGEAGRNEWPEAGSHRGRRLRDVWDKLSAEAQAELTAVAEKAPW